MMILFEKEQGYNIGIAPIHQHMPGVEPSLCCMLLLHQLYHKTPAIGLEPMNLSVNSRTHYLLCYAGK